MGKKLNKKIFPCLLLISIFITYAFYEQLTDNYIYVFQVYYQKFTDLLYPYFYEVDEAIPDDDLIVVNTLDKNYLCNIPNVRHNSKQALYHLNKDYNALQSSFDACENKDQEIELIEIKDVNASEFLIGKPTSFLSI